MKIEEKVNKPNFTDDELHFIKMHLLPQVEKELIAEDIINKIKVYEEEARNGVLKYVKNG